MDRFYKAALLVGAWIKSLPVDKTWHIIGNMILASFVATASNFIGMDIMIAFFGVLSAGILFEVVQYTKTRVLRIRDSLEDLVANLLGAGSVFLPLLLS